MSTFISDVKNPKPAATTAVTALPIPAFGDLGKAANDVCIPFGRCRLDGDGFADMECAGV